MGITQFATPNLTLTFDEPGLDLTTASSAYVTFRCGMNKVTKTGEDLTIGQQTIGIRLEQKDTGRFRIGDKMRIQANFMIGGERVASEVAEVVIDEQLLQEVIE